MNGHRLEARVTQPYIRPEYSFSLRIDGDLQHGSDFQPGPWRIRRQTLIRMIGGPLLLFPVVIAVIALAQVIARLLHDLF